MTSPWMTTREVAELLRFVDATGRPDAERAWEYLKDAQVQSFKRGRINLYRREDVEGTLRVTRVVKLPRQRTA